MDPALMAQTYQTTGEKKSGSIIAGAVLIGVGLALGGSVFTGDFSLSSWFFDGLGIFWIGLGLFKIYRDGSR